MKHLLTIILFASSLLLGQFPALPNLLELSSISSFTISPNVPISNDETTKETYHFVVGDINRMDVNISYGLGELNIESNTNADEIEGFIEYSPQFLSPEVEYRTLGSKGKLKISIRSMKYDNHDYDYDYDYDSDEDEYRDKGGSRWSFDFNWKNIRDREYESTADFRLPQSVPMDISMDFGLGEASIDLSNLSISDFDLDCGLSDTKIIMRTPNPVSCREITIDSGLGDLNVIGLGNLRAREFDLDVGIGSADIDLRGEIVEDMEVDIQVGLGSLDLILPESVNIKLEIDHSFLSSVDVNGLVKDGDEWVTREWQRNRPTIEIDISVGLGSVDVDVED